MLQSVPSKLTQTYPARGPLQQFRFEEATAFTCFRCGESKKSKLLTVYKGDWSKRLCNGCYGRLLSLYEIKAGTAPHDEKAELLALALLGTVAVDDVRRSEQLLKAAEKRAERLSHEGLLFVTTAEHVARTLDAGPQLEWSPAVIGLCKAVEAEIVRRILRPLEANTAHEDLTSDKNDKDIARVAAFCSAADKNPPELGTFAYFLQTVIHSERRRITSPLIRSFLKLATTWTGSQWLLDAKGFHPGLQELITRFRNRAAHIDELGKEDYLACREHVIGSDGLLWKLVVSTFRN